MLIWDFEKLLCKTHFVFIRIGLSQVSSHFPEKISLVRRRMDAPVNFKQTWELCKTLAERNESFWRVESVSFFCSLIAFVEVRGFKITFLTLPALRFRQLISEGMTKTATLTDSIFCCLILVFCFYIDCYSQLKTRKKFVKSEIYSNLSCQADN